MPLRSGGAAATPKASGELCHVCTKRVYGVMLGGVFGQPGLGTSQEVLQFVPTSLTPILILPLFSLFSPASYSLSRDWLIPPLPHLGVML
jgi:hypothetical protein